MLDIDTDYEIFKENGKPLVFYVTKTLNDNKCLRILIKRFGGSVTNSIATGIILTSKMTITYSPRPQYSRKFIYHCVAENKIVDISQYLLQGKSQPTSSALDANLDFILPPLGEKDLVILVLYNLVLKPNYLPKFSDYTCHEISYLLGFWRSPEYIEKRVTSLLEENLQKNDISEGKIMLSSTRSNETLVEGTSKSKNCSVSGSAVGDFKNSSKPTIQNTQSGDTFLPPTIQQEVPHSESINNSELNISLLPPSPESMPYVELKRLEKPISFSENLKKNHLNLKANLYTKNDLKKLSTVDKDRESVFPETFSIPVSTPDTKDNGFNSEMSSKPATNSAIHIPYTKPRELDTRYEKPKIKRKEQYNRYIPFDARPVIYRPSFYSTRPDEEKNSISSSSNLHNKEQSSLSKDIPGEKEYSEGSTPHKHKTVESLPNITSKKVHIENPSSNPFPSLVPLPQETSNTRKNALKSKIRFSGVTKEVEHEKITSPLTRSLESITNTFNFVLESAKGAMKKGSSLNTPREPQVECKYPLTASMKSLESMKSIKSPNPEIPINSQYSIGNSSSTKSINYSTEFRDSHGPNLLDKTPDFQFSSDNVYSFSRNKFAKEATPSPAIPPSQPTISRSYFRFARGVCSTSKIENFSSQPTKFGFIKSENFESEFIKSENLESEFIKSENLESEFIRSKNLKSPFIKHEFIKSEPSTTPQQYSFTPSTPPLQTTNSLSYHMSNSVPSLHEQYQLRLHRNNSKDGQPFHSSSKHRISLAQSGSRSVDVRVNKNNSSSRSRSNSKNRSLFVSETSLASKVRTRRNSISDLSLISQVDWMKRFYNQPQHLVLQALKSSSFNFGKAQFVLDSLANKNEFPFQRDIWSLSDDDILVNSSDVQKIIDLKIKHGSKLCRKRLKFLKALDSID